jgi:EAL domain-containing protein (putative c-di-GMP-specific phosphodiesterase class I)
MNMLDDPGAAAIVRYTIDLAHSLGMKVVAESTSSEAIWDALAQMGCDEAQGYYICPPCPGAHLSRLLASREWIMRHHGDRFN